MKNMFAFTMAALVEAGAAFGGDHGFLRKGDTWVMSGDSITYIGLYAQTVRDAIEHFHPGSGIRVVNVGVWGQIGRASCRERV